jgi:serine/threonine protein kinase
MSLKPNGELLGEFRSNEVGRFTVVITATDGGEGHFQLEPILLDVRQLDADVPEYGPNNKGCANGGLPVDASGSLFDGKFTSCDCSKIALYVGDNCDDQCDEPDRKDAKTGRCVGDSSDRDSTTIPLVVGVLVVLFLVAVGADRFYKFRVSMRPIDFDDLNQKMIENGTIMEGQLFSDRKPRELKRSDVSLLEQVGRGAFGAVWKAMLNERGRPEYLVAAKTVLEEGAVSAAATEDLTTEATVMAQLEGHRNLVSIIGVVTSGTPLILVLSYCDHGSMLIYLRKRAVHGRVIAHQHKIDFGAQIARGMEHLSGRHFIHRDLAARNVLLTSGQSVSNLVCKVADFGLSRAGGSSGVTSDETNEVYYRSQNGILPVRWTAPEALEQLVFTHASDVWSFGIVIIEIIQDGVKPLADIKSNQGVVHHTVSGGIHPQPRECDAGESMVDFYNVACECFALSPAARPNFSGLAEVLEKLSQVGKDDGAAATDPQLSEPSVSHKHGRVSNLASAFGYGRRSTSHQARVLSSVSSPGSNSGERSSNPTLYPTNVSHYSV